MFVSRDSKRTYVRILCVSARFSRFCLWQLQPSRLKAEMRSGHPRVLWYWGNDMVLDRYMMITYC